MTDRDQRTIFSPNGDSGEPERFGAYEDFAATESRPVDFAPDMVSLGFIRAVIRRSARFWSATAIVGLLVGLGVYVARPHEFQATATVFITLSPYEDAITAPGNNQAIAMTPEVAQLALDALGLHQSVSSFLTTYIATSTTDELLTVTASARSADQAVLRSSAVASAFLKFRADELQAQQNLVIESLQQQISQTTHHISSVDAQISQLSSQPTSPAQQSQISRLRAEATNATAKLDGLQEALIGNQSTNQPAVTAAIKNSEILIVAPIPHSRLKAPALYAAIGLFLGLALGLSVVVLRALVSDRLRRRDDIAYTLDAPVKLSLATLGARRLLPSLPGRTAKRNLDMRRFLAHLKSAVPTSTQGPAGLAIVAVDNGPVVARAVAALATSYASQGNQVVASDLSMGAYLAHLLGIRKPGAHAVSHNGVNFTVTLPDRDDPAPVGPLRAVTSPAVSAQARDAQVASHASADLLLSLVTLDPALGSDHLATWATNAVVVVTAGRSSAERIHGVGEMIRLAGSRLDSVVLIGADKSDKSLGLARAPEEQAGMGVLAR